MRRLFKKIGRSQKSDPEAPSPSPRPRSLALHTICEDANPTLNIIAIHGHGGHYTTSWTHPASEICWLKDMLPKVFAGRNISIRVLSLGYSKNDEDNVGAGAIAAFLVDETKKLDGNGVLWIAHSFGGPLVKGVLVSDRDIAEMTTGVLFFGVPREVGTGSWGSMAVATAGTEEGLSDEMRRLKNEVRWLGETERAFMVLYEEGKLAPRWFVEARDGFENVSRGEPERNTTIYLRKTHGEMVRFGSSSDEDWKRVEQVLLNLPEIDVEQTVVNQEAKLGIVVTA